MDCNLEGFGKIVYNADSSTIYIFKNAKNLNMNEKGKAL